MELKTVIKIMIIVQLINQVYSLHHQEHRNLRKVKTNHFASVQAACTRDTLMVITTMQQPFHGKIYAKGYPTTCYALGNSTRDVTLVFNVSNCGVKIFEDSNQKLVYEVHVYIQFDLTVQQVNDEQILVSCNPIEFLLLSTEPEARHRLATARQLRYPDLFPQQMGRSVPSKSQTDDEMVKALSTGIQSPIVDTWMDILSNTDTGGKPIHDSASVGEEVTMLIKIHRKPGLDTKVVNCIAHDGSGQTQQELIDQNGCAVETSIMPNLQAKSNSQNELLHVYAPFAAFKFPDKDNLHLKCQVIVCNKECPLKQLCNPSTSRRFNKHVASPSTKDGNRQGIMSHENVIDIIDVFNAFEVKAPQLELDTLNAADFNLNDAEPKEFDEDTTCLSTSRMILTFGVLLGILFIALVFSVSIFVSTRRNKHVSRKWSHLPMPRSYESYT